MNSSWQNSIPSASASDPVAWAEEIGLKVDGHAFESERCPQSIVPMRCMSLADKSTKIATYIAPVQSGKSTAGEAILAYWATYAWGLIQFNWQDDLKAKERWKTRILAMLKSADLTWLEENICEGWFKNSTVLMQGVFSENALNSDTIPYQINEEVHLWKPGHLSMARDRQTRIWNSKAMDISNASRAEFQLHLAYKAGTMEQWETACPICGVKHAMHFRFNPDKPQLGGLRWDASTRLADGRPNYNKLTHTIRYQFPCGHEIMGDIASRRKLKGDYSTPQNPGATMSHRSFISEVVSYDEISWLDLIKEWHSAIRAIKAGDQEPIFRFVTRRECKFYDEGMIPFRGQILINRAIVKSRDGIPNRAGRLWAFDRQKGHKFKGETPHFWLVIRDIDTMANSLLVWEGLCQTEADVIATLKDHNCALMSGCGDATWDRDNMLAFAFRSEFNAITGSAQRDFFSVPEPNGDRIKRIWSKPDLLWKTMNMPGPKYDYKIVWNQITKTGESTADVREPRHWSYHKLGIIKLLFFLRSHVQVAGENGIKWEVPGDVSDDYQKQLNSWDVVAEAQGKTNQQVEQYRQIAPADHMLMCEAYIAMLMAMSGILGNRLAILGVQDTLLGANNNPSTGKISS